MSKVELVCISQPRIEGVKSAEELIAYAARVSNPSNQLNTNTAPKLLQYLAKNSHWSPFEMVSMTVGITTTRDIARQILRHRSFSFQEFSQRYTVQSNFVLREARMQDPKNRQSSHDTDDNALKMAWLDKQTNIISAAENAYTWALENGIAKEQARAVLPEGCTESVLYMAGTIRSFLHLIKVRNHPATQKEHREIAIACADAIEPIFPMIKEFVNV